MKLYFLREILAEKLNDIIQSIVLNQFFYLLLTLLFVPLMSQIYVATMILSLRAKADIDNLAEKQAFIDGRELTNIEKYRVSSDAFDLIYPDNNVFDIRAGPTRAVSDGYWIFLKPMIKGKHNIQVMGSCSSGKTKVDVMLHLDVT